MDELCLDFINSKWYGTHKLNKEILEENELILDFFKKRNLCPEVLPDGRIRSSLMELRSFLSKTLEAFVTKGEMSKEDVKILEQYLGGSPCLRGMATVEGKYGILLRPLSRDWNWIMAEIAASFVQLLGSGDADRIKFCENPDCRWVFYDETRSRTKRWCDDTCASRMKVRRFRARRKEV